VMRRGRLGPPRSVTGLTEHDLMMEATGALGRRSPGEGGA
jgi:hypothetical protein